MSHLNGAYYGPAVPPPKSYHRPSHGGGGGRDGCCCGCLSCFCGCIFDCILGLICKILTTIIIILAVLAFLFWFIVRPNVIKFHVTDASLTRFDYTTNNTLHYDLTLNVSIRNPNRRVGVYYDQIEALALYEDVLFGNLTLGSFYQHHKNTTFVSPIFKGQRVTPLAKVQVSEFDKEKGSGVYTIDLKLFMTVRFKFLLFKSGSLNLNLPVDIHGFASLITKITFGEMGRFENHVVKGGIKLPIGFRFCPTDEELLLHYLKKKAFAQQLPASVISEFDVFQTEPWKLPGELRENRYFFSNRSNGNIKRPAGSGCWKSVGKEKQIIHSESNQVIGMKETLFFCKGSHETRTQWVMHELRLVASYPCQMPVADFAVYRIFQKNKMKTRRSHGKKPSSSSKLQRLVDVKASFFDFTVDFNHDDIGPPTPCSPCLSEGCSEISSSKLD